jgi:hypothetical protein
MLGYAQKERMPILEKIYTQEWLLLGQKLAKIDIFDYIGAVYKRTQRYSFFCDVILEAYARASG